LVRTRKRRHLDVRTDARPELFRKRAAEGREPMSLENIANVWRTFQRTVNRLIDDYLYCFWVEQQLWDPRSEDSFIYFLFLEEEKDRKR
jgi:hypothetical protein